MPHTMRLTWCTEPSRSPCRPHRPAQAATPPYDAASEAGAQPTAVFQREAVAAERRQASGGAAAGGAMASAAPRSATSLERERMLHMRLSISAYPTRNSPTNTKHQGWRLAAAALFHSYALRGRGAATGG
eukprot:gene6986-13682_t